MLPPLRFVPVAKARSWGADRLRSLGKPALANQRVGETWELADLPDDIADGQSRVACGPLAGLKMRELRASRRDELLGLATPAPDGAFPLLVKYLDAAENLSLQVHPDARYAALHPSAHLKTEAWIVVRCTPGARVYRGIDPRVTREEFAAALAAGRALEHITSFEVAPGDCVYLPSGVCHALGGGILAAEVQTPSDTTFRVWDWDRNDPARPLHLAEAWECMKFGREQDDGVAAFVRADDAPRWDVGGVTTRRLCRSAFFTVESMECARDASFELEPTGVPEVWMTTAGHATWRTASDTVHAEAGATVLRAARIEPGTVHASAGTHILRFICASPLDRALA
jgi:mannose-6-phosphate isomerase